jgi:hypothetical protein
MSLQIDLAGRDKRIILFLDVDALLPAGAGL